MVHILSDGLFHPRELLRYRNKNGWFVLAYFVLLALFCSIGAGMYYVAYSLDMGFTAANAACDYDSGTLVCDEAARDYTEPLDFFGGDAYFLPSTADVADVDISGENAIVFQDEYIALFSSGRRVIVLDVTSQIAAGLTLDDILSSLKVGVLIAIILFNIVANVILLSIYALMAAIPLVRLQGYIRFGRAYTILAFATAPFALLLTFHNILGLPDWALMILMVVAFRSPFLVIRALYEQAYVFMMPKDPPSDGNGSDEGDSDDGPSDTGPTDEE
jgi:hypothetical protein